MMPRVVEEVLVVDADGAERRWLRSRLTGWGFAVVEARQCAEAVRYLATHARCRMVISDVALGHGESGFDLLDEIERRFPEVSVVLSTDDLHPDVAVRGFRQGATDVLQKPVSSSALRRALDDASLETRMRGATREYIRSLESAVGERTGKLRQIMSDLERSYDVTIEAMGDALDMRDEETEGHSKRVTAYTLALARQLRLPAAELKTIARGALLHDIGKIAIPDSILLKPGKLTAQEMDVMRGHCEHGYRIVRKIPFLEAASEIVLSHQERFDGTGYPRALRGEEIHLGARIFAIADTLDAITSDRPYRKGSTFAQAIEEIERCQGTQFDPEIVTAFLAMPRRTWPEIRANVGRHSHASDLMRSVAA